MIRSFKKGQQTEFQDDKTLKYPAVFVQDNGGNISISRKTATLNYRLYFVDLVHVSEGTKDNEQDVKSDMFSIAMDIIAQMNFGNYNDWQISTDNNVDLFIESGDDLYAGCYVDISFGIQFKQNICEVPSNIFITPSGQGSSPGTVGDLKLVYDFEYIATGTEGTILTIPTIQGKKVLFITRESSPIYKVSNSPNSSEFIWNDIIITLGAPVNPAGGERFLILYRNY